MDRQTDRQGQILMPPDYRHGGIKNFFLYFHGAKYITSNLGVTLTGKNLLLKGAFFPIRGAPNEEGEGLRLSHEKAHPLPSGTNFQ